MSEIKQLIDIPFVYMIMKNDCEHCKLQRRCSYEQLGYCFAQKNEKDCVDKKPAEE